MPSDVNAPHQIVDARNPAAQPVILSGAMEGHVLVKNFNNTLPLVKPRLLAVFGYDAIVPAQMNEGVGALYGTGTEFDPQNAQTAPNGTLIVGGE